MKKERVVKCSTSRSEWAVLLGLLSNYNVLMVVYKKGISLFGCIKVIFFTYKWAWRNVEIVEGSMYYRRCVNYTNGELSWK